MNLQKLASIEHPDTAPIAPPEQPAPWGRCYICRQPLTTSWVRMPLVSAGQRGFYWGKAHLRCYDSLPEVTV